jgi:DNA-binding transcriptional LysR family regulator
VSTALELRFQQAVIALAEELNYTRAANRLNISQPALTKQIHEIERILHLRLFERDKKKVKLTEAGAAYAEEARLSIMHGERAIHFARAADRGADRVLTFGSSLYTDPDLVAALFAVHLPLFPNLKIRLESGFAPELVQWIAAGVIDLAMVTGVPAFRSVSMTPLVTAPLHVALRIDHPASTRERISLRDLGNMCWAIFARRVHPNVYDTLFETAKMEGVHGQEIQHIMTVQECVPLVVEHNCAGFVTRSTAQRTSHDSVVFRPLEEEALHLKTSLVIRADNRSRLVNDFARTYIRQFQSKLPRRDEKGSIDLPPAGSM